MATPLTFTVAPALLAAGTHDTAIATVPAGYTNARLTLNIATADYENTANRIDYTVNLSPDGGVTWQPETADWHGGVKVARNGTVDPAPYVEEDLTGSTGWKAKGSITLNNPMTVGFTLLLT